MRGGFEARQVSVSFGGVKAVDGLDVVLSEGEVLGIAGPNGSGKSTFLNAISGLVPRTGEVLLAGKAIPPMRPRLVAHAGLQRTFQSPQAYLELSALENSALADYDTSLTGLLGAWPARRWMWRLERSRWSRSLDLLDRVGLPGRSEQLASQLTYGERRLLELSRALAARPTILVMDEPAAGLNAAETEDLRRLLAALVAEGMSLLVVEHKIDFLDALCHRILVLESGREIAQGKPGQIWSEERVASAYLGISPDA